MLLTWDIYEIRSNNAELHGVMLRGRIRKFTIDQELSCLMENASDEENVVRFALQSGAPVEIVEEFIKTLIPGVQVLATLKSVPNPVLSKLKVNDSSRYES